VESIEEILEDVRNGDYSESDAAVLITRDADKGFLTFTYHGCDNDEGRELVREAARCLGYLSSEIN
jgi:hypothetical protein